MLLSPPGATGGLSRLKEFVSLSNHPPRTSQTPRLLAISQPATPRQIPLPGTGAEVDAIETLGNGTDRLDVTRLDDREVTTTAVLRHMKECNWILPWCSGRCESDQERFLSHRQSPGDYETIVFSHRTTRFARHQREIASCLRKQSILQRAC